ncbi:hypothetical protein L1278_000256 [Pontibacter sp. HSC-36F09]|nr:hypothetical protein [Pontibacter sp. HSC-36F09]
MKKGKGVYIFGKLVYMREKMWFFVDFRGWLYHKIWWHCQFNEVVTGS